MSILIFFFRQRKPLLFVLHNEDIALSRTYWELLPQFESIICEKFLILGWKIENRDHYGELLSDRIIIVEELLTHLRNRAAGIFVIVPDRDSVKFYESMDISHGDVVDNRGCDRYKANLNRLLEKTVKLMSMYINEDFFHNMT